MRFRLSMVAVLVFAFAAVLYSQTRVVPTNLGSGGVAGPKLYAILASGSVAVVDIGAGLMLDTSGPVPVLKAVAASNHRVHVHKPLSPNVNLNLPETPLAGTLRLHVNGVLWSETEDYTVTNNTVTAVNGQTFLTGYVVNAEYSY